MFCGKCGSNIPEGSTTCPVCGGQIGPAVPPMPDYNPNPYSGYVPPTPPKKSNKLPIIIAAAAVFVVAVALVLYFFVFSGGSGGAKDIAEMYFEAYYVTGDADALLDEINDDVLQSYFEYCNEEFDVDDDYDDQIDGFKDAVESDYDDEIEYVEEELDGDVTPDIEIVDYRELPTSNFDYWAEDLDDAGIELEEAMIVLVWISYTNDDGETYGFYDSLQVFKIDGKWYPNPWGIYGYAYY